MISVNQQAVEIVDQMTLRAEQLGISVIYLSCGTRVIDLGLQTPGGFLAGKYTAEASLGGMGEVSLLPLDFGDFWLPGVAIAVDHAEIGCMASQYAGWGIQRGEFFGEIALLESKERTATVRALEDSEVYALGKQDFLLALERSEPFRKQLLDVFFKRQ